MFKIDRKPYGFHLVFGDFILKAEMEQWLQESKKMLAGQKDSFGVFVDMRALKPLPTDSQDVMVKGQQLYKQAGMIRSVVILDNTITTMQFKRLAKESGIYEWERYIDASTALNWEKAAVEWLVSGTDPDL